MQAKSKYVTWLISKNSSDIMRFPTWNYFYESFIYLILFRLKLNCLSRQVQFWYGCLEAVGTRWAETTTMLACWSHLFKLRGQTLQILSSLIRHFALLGPKSGNLIALFLFFYFSIFLFLKTKFSIHFLYCCRFSTMITLLVKSRPSFPSPIWKEQTVSYSFLKICCCTYEL